MIRNSTFTLAVTFLLCFSLNLNAATISSTATGGEWNEASSWVGGAIPSVSDDVVIQSGGTVYIRFMSSAYTAYCKSLTVNGTLDFSTNSLFVGNTYNSGGNESLIVNGTLSLSGSYSNNFHVNGTLKFNSGSTFNMSSGQLVINGNTGNVSTSVPSGTAILDISDIAQSNFNFTNGTLYILHPHAVAGQPCIKGAKTFSGNATVSLGNNNPPNTATDYVIDPIAKPIFQNLEVNFDGTNGSKAILRDLTVKGVVGILNGKFYNDGGTRLYVGGDMNVGVGGIVEGDVEFNNLTAQQNINALVQPMAITSVLFKGNLIVNSKRVKLKLDLEIPVGYKMFFTSGKFDANYYTLTLNAEPVGFSDTKFISTHDLYSEIGTLKIKNINAKTVFPVGYEMGEGFFSYTPIEITPSSTSDFTVSAHPSNQPTLTSFDTIAPRWDINRTLGSATANIQFQWNTADEKGAFTAFRNNCKVYHFNGSTWNAITTSGATTNGTVHTKMATNVSSFSPFTIFTSSSLPVSLISFNAKATNDKAVLNWSTASEQNNVGFGIERSLDGADFNEIGYVKGAGNSAVQLNYNFTDNQFNQAAFYRLRQEDFDGKITYSRIIQLEKAKKGDVVKLYPNPITEGGPLSIELISESNKTVLVNVTDVSGRVIFQKNYDAASGILTIPTVDFVRGIYFVKIQNGLDVKVEKVVKY